MRSVQIKTDKVLPGTPDDQLLLLVVHLHPEAGTHHVLDPSVGQPERFEAADVVDSEQVREEPNFPEEHVVAEVAEQVPIVIRLIWKLKIKIGKLILT